jgi:magnesium-transporting ATPase (P-type)
VVAGDIVVLSAGDVVPADCRVLDDRHLLVDQATLTGESYPVHKAPPPVPAATPPRLPRSGRRRGPIGRRRPGYGGRRRPTGRPWPGSRSAGRR